jgi:hypothetical protein
MTNGGAAGQHHGVEIFGRQRPVCSFGAHQGAHDGGMASRA